ncbi:hypothetical protein F503_05732 [Ophiostoma piceae UAMH 11346]|uniref:Uncharacterized protein n=1 Tax=Ophiostoma piceae (strain UAMH 11346) TaxID=1262450 RepID=S3CCI0_OPHP1|nr:hypothetical protein F503_05732 [Ophiostoma piceae UAMH 11346]
MPIYGGLGYDVPGTGPTGREGHGANTQLGVDVNWYFCNMAISSIHGYGYISTLHATLVPASCMLQARRDKTLLLLDCIDAIDGVPRATCSQLRAAPAFHAM